MCEYDKVDSLGTCTSCRQNYDEFIDLDKAFKGGGGGDHLDGGHHQMSDFDELAAQLQLKAEDFSCSEEERHRCHLCTQEFTSTNEYKNHLENHGSQMGNLLCTLCSSSSKEVFENSWRLWQHIRKQHQHSYHHHPLCGFLCTICSKEFKLPLNFHLHMLIHLGEHPESCRFCEKTFRTKPSLRKHELVHTGEKAFECAQCPSAFKTRDELKQHGFAHLTVKLFQCSHCRIKFKYQASMKRHEKKGRCKIGKYWCPLVKKNYNKRKASEKNQVKKGNENPPLLTS